MTSTKTLVYGTGQRIACVVVGLGFAALGAGEVIAGPLGARIFGGLVVAAAVGFTLRAAKVGLVADDRGLTDRTIEHTRRWMWADIKDVSLVGSRTDGGANRVRVVVSLASGEHPEVELSGGFSPSRAEALKAEIVKRISKDLSAPRRQISMPEES